MIEHLLSDNKRQADYVVGMNQEKLHTDGSGAVKYEKSFKDIDRYSISLNGVGI